MTFPGSTSKRVLALSAIFALVGIASAVLLLLVASFWYGPQMPTVIRQIVVFTSPVLFPASAILPGGHPTTTKRCSSMVLAVIANGLVYGGATAGIGMVITVVKSLLSKINR